MDAIQSCEAEDLGIQDSKQGQERVEQDAALLQLARTLKAGGYRFTTVTPATHARVNSRPGNEWARSIEDVFGWSRPFQAGLLPAPIFELMLASGILEQYQNGWRSRIRLSSLNNQLFIHSAYPTTDTHAVFFGPDTYRFVLALNHHLSLRSRPVKRAIDIGCGAGPGAIVTALACPDAEVIAIDINDEALRLSAINAALAGASKVTTRYSNLFSAVDGEFDLIVTNPPYLLDPSERAYRHGGGVLGEGLSVAIVRSALERLAPGGTLLLYTGVAMVDGVDHFHASVASLLHNQHVRWGYQELDPDVFGEELLQPAYAHADRIAAVLLTAVRHE